MLSPTTSGRISGKRSPGRRRERSCLRLTGTDLLYRTGGGASPRARRWRSEVLVNSGRLAMALSCRTGMPAYHASGMRIHLERPAYAPGRQKARYAQLSPIGTQFSLAAQNGGSSVRAITKIVTQRYSALERKRPYRQAGSTTRTLPADYGYRSMAGSSKPTDAEQPVLWVWTLAHPAKLHATSRLHPRRPA